MVPGPKSEIDATSRLEDQRRSKGYTYLPTETKNLKTFRMTQSVFRAKAVVILTLPICHDVPTN